MAFGLTADGFKIKRLDDIKSELEQRFKNEFGDSIDLSSSSPAGQFIGIFAERESLVWELAQDVYNSQYPLTAEGKQLDNAVSLTGTTREGPTFSMIEDGIARGANSTLVEAGTIISVEGNPEARFITQADAVIDQVDGATFKSLPIKLIAESFGPTQASAGTLTVIETPVGGLESFTNESDAELGSNTEEDPDLKARRDQELQIAGAATIEAIRSELLAREDVEEALVFQNVDSIPDIDGRPAHSLDIVVLGGNDPDIAEAIFLVVGGGIKTIGDITENVTDSQGFEQVIKFSRPDLVDIYIEADITTDPNLYPGDGDLQVENAFLAYGETLTIGQDVVVKGSNSLICSINNIPGILDIEIRIGKAADPPNDDNVIIDPREISDFDSSRIEVVSV